MQIQIKENINPLLTWSTSFNPRVTSNKSWKKSASLTQFSKTLSCKKRLILTFQPWMPGQPKSRKEPKKINKKIWKKGEGLGEKQKMQ